MASVESETRGGKLQVAKLVTEQLVKEIHIDIIPDPPKNPTDIRQPQAFLSEELH